MATSPVASILAVFTSLIEWFVEAVGAITPIFWAEGALTFVGTITVIGVAIAVTLMVIAMIRSLLRLQ